MEEEEEQGEEENAGGKVFLTKAVAKYFIEALLGLKDYEHQHLSGVGRRTESCRVQEYSATPGWGRGGPRGGTMVPWPLVVKLSGAATPPPDPLPPSLPFLSAALPRKRGVAGVPRPPWRCRPAGQPPRLHAASAEGDVMSAECDTHDKSFLGPNYVSVPDVSDNEGVA